MILDQWEFQLEVLDVFDVLFFLSLKKELGRSMCTSSEK